MNTSQPSCERTPGKLPDVRTLYFVYMIAGIMARGQRSSCRFLLCSFSALTHISSNCCLKMPSDIHVRASESAYHYLHAVGQLYT